MSAWGIWNVLPELTDALLQLSSAPSEIPEYVMQSIERFVILLYDRTSTCTDINKARKKLHKEEQCASDTTNQGSSGGTCQEGSLPGRPCVHLIPTTKAPLEEHVKRAAYQGGHECI